jgi:predicted PurR-regulated permease PerM
MQETQKTVTYSKTMTAAAVVVLATGIILLLIYAKSLLMPLITGAFLAMLMVPAVTRMELYNIPRVLAIFIALLLSTVAFMGIGWFFGQQISNFSQDLSGVEIQFDTFINNISVFLEENLGMKDALNFKSINDKIFLFLKENATNISSAAFSTLGSLGLLILIPVYIFMFLLYRDHFTVFAVRLFNNHPQARVIEVVTDLRSVIQKYILGMLKVMVILAILNIIALSALGIRHALFFGIFAAMMNVVPYVGPMIGSVLPILFALLTKDSLFYPLAVFVCFTIIQSIEGNYLTPKIVGSNVNINPIISLVALLIGSLLWGVVGMILFIPLAAIIKKLLELSPSTEVYGFLMGEEVPSLAKPKKKLKLPRFIRKDKI